MVRLWKLKGCLKPPHFLISTRGAINSSHFDCPGVVDTEMQQDIREKFGSNMSKEGLQRFIDLHEKKQLVPPEEPGRVFANLALKGWSADLNGQFLRYNDSKLESYK